MDLYYAMTNYHILCCLLHKMKFNSNRKAKLWVSSNLIENQPSIIDDLRGSGVFDDVIEFEEIKLVNDEGAKLTKGVLDKEIVSICGAIKKKYTEEIERSKDIYICQDAHGLGIYLNKNSIKYIFFEDACGGLSNWKIGFELLNRSSPVRGAIAKELKLFGESTNVVKRLGDLSAQVEGYYDVRDEDFSVRRILNELEENDLNRILKIYHCKKYVGDERKNLLLTWYYSNIGMMTLDEQRDFFASLVDYFGGQNERLFVKPHPTDSRPDYKEWFKDAVVLDRYMPSELLPFLIEGKFEKGITNWSTSVYGLKGILKEIVNFDKDIDDTYRDFDRYFAIVQYLRVTRKKDKIQRLALVNINKLQLLQLMRCYFKSFKKYYEIVETDGDIWIVEQYHKKYLKKNCIILEKSGEYTPQNVLLIKRGRSVKSVCLYNLPYIDMNIEKEMKYSGGKLMISVQSMIKYTGLLEEEIGIKNETIDELKEEYMKSINKLEGVVMDYEEKLKIAKNEIDEMINSSSWKITEPLRKLKGIKKKYIIKNGM